MTIYFTHLLFFPYVVYKNSYTTNINCNKLIKLRTPETLHGNELNLRKSCKLTFAVYLMKEHWIFTTATILVTESKQKTLA